MNEEIDRREMDRNWIMAQFHEPWSPTIIMDVTMTILKFAACGAGFAIMLFILSACSTYRDAQIRRQLDSMQPTPWETWNPVFYSK